MVVGVQVGPEADDAGLGRLESFVDGLRGDAEEFGDQGDAAAVDEEGGDGKLGGGEQGQ